MITETSAALDAFMRADGCSRLCGDSFRVIERIV